MDGVFKSLQPKDVKITPFQAFRAVETDFKNSDFRVYDTEYEYLSSYPFTYSGHNSIDVGYPPEEARFDTTGVAPNEYFKTVMHQQLDAIYYRNYLSHNHSTPDTTNINYQYRDLGFAASVISCPRRLIGEGIMPTSVYLEVGADEFVDDGYGNLIISGTLEPSYGHVAFSTTFNTYYKFVDEPTGSQYQPLSYGGCRLQAFMNGVTFAKDGTYNVALKLENSRVELRALENPYVKKILNFTNKDFAIAFKATGNGTLLTKQTATDEWTTSPNGTIISSSAVPQNYPYKITLGGGITFNKRGGDNNVSVTGGSVGQNIVIQRVGDRLQIWSNGSKVQDVADTCMTGGCYGSDILCANNSDLLIGCDDDGSNSLTGTLTYLHMFNRSLSSAEISALNSNNGSINGYSGNVFYNTGIIAITKGGAIGKTPTLLRFNSTVTLLETQVFCTVGPGDFTRTLNPTTHTWNPITNQLETACRYTGSEFRPYVTTVGLYDDFNNLIAIGKLSTPVQTSRTTDTTFVVKFDR